jgi:hypothetical protein
LVIGLIPLGVATADEHHDVDIIRDQFTAGANRDMAIT